jgi:hypothetical protein
MDVRDDTAARTVLSALAKAPTIEPTEEEILGWADDAKRLRSASNAMPGSREYEETYQRLYSSMCQCEELLLRSPCVSDRVAAEKLRFGALESLINGERADGLDLESLRGVIEWLEQRQ